LSNLWKTLLTRRSPREAALIEGRFQGVPGSTDAFKVALERNMEAVFSKPLRFYSKYLFFYI